MAVEDSENCPKAGGSLETLLQGCIVTLSGLDREQVSCYDHRLVTT
jgi:hypothetical protein